MNSQRLYRLFVVIAVVTILCHATAFAPIRRDVVSHVASVELSVDRFDKKPEAVDDMVYGEEEIPLLINVLANDRSGRNDDDDDDESADDQIDPSSIDLNPDTDAIDKTLVITEGVFVAENDGEVIYTPTLDFNGNAQVRYTVNNFRGERSNKANVKVTLANVNDAPQISGQYPSQLSTRQGQSITIDPSNLIVSDPDNNYPQGFDIRIDDGENYTVSETSIIPAADFFGPLIIPVAVSDGTLYSNSYDLSLLVTEETNDPPVITGQQVNPIVINEDQALAITLGDLIVSDPDNTYPTGFTLTVLDGTNYAHANNTITPTLNFNGTMAVRVMVNDGTNDSQPYELQLSVTSINDPPVITGQTPDPITIGEESPLTLTFSQIQVTDPDHAESQLSFIIPDGDNYSVADNVITPDADFSGNLTIPIQVSDGTDLSDTYQLNIAVTAENDVPSIIGQTPAVVDEDQAWIINLSQLTVTDSDNDYPDDFALEFDDGDNYSISGSSILPDPNYYGQLNVPVRVNDQTSISNTFTFIITVNPINDPPVITAQNALTTPENEAITLAAENFQITDPDHSAFTLTVAAGTDYTFTGTTITPASGFNGTLSVPVTVTDGAGAVSGVFNAQVSVTEVNDPPLITGHNTLTYNEDTPFTIQLSDLIVTDPDDEYSTGFTLTVLDGTNYTYNGNTVTPNANFNGTLSVNVLVNDGVLNSNSFPVSVTINAVNDAPAIVGQPALSVTEDQSITIDLSNLIVDDPDNSYPTGFTLTALPGANYQLNGLVVTPNTDFIGPLTVPVEVSDGSASSNTFDLVISVVGVNDPPIITGQSIVSTEEDTPVTIDLSQLTVFDPDNSFPSGFILNVLDGTGYTYSGTTITPALDFNGTLNVSVRVNDGTDDSETFQFQIQVGNSNDPPTITAQSPLSTNEEQPITISLTHLVVTDVDNPYPTGFTILLSEGENFTVAGDVVTPSPNFVGMITVPVRVNDGVNNSATFDLKITVNPVNDAPSFDAIADQNVQENAMPPLVTVSNISKGPNENDQRITLSATSSNTALVSNPTINYDGTSTSAELRYTLVPNASGVATITVVATDNGLSGAPHQNSFSSTFQVNVSEINAAPTLATINNVTIQEDAAPMDIALTGITAGPGESQPLAIEVTTNKSELFEVFELSYTTPSQTGILKVKPASNANGTASVSVKVVDNGSNQAPSVNQFSRTFTITIQPVNDPPVFESTPVTLAVVNEPYHYDVDFKDIETPGLAVSFAVKPSWLSITGVNGSTRISGTPPAAAAGNNPVTLRINDAPHVVDQSFTIIVNTRPVVSEITLDAVEDSEFTFSQQTFASGYNDADGHAMSAVLITQLPTSGSLIWNGRALTLQDTIAVSSLGQLSYKPNENFFGRDAFFFKAKDSYHFSLSPAAANINVGGVNDLPVIVLAKDTLTYEVNGEPSLLNSMIDIVDPDDDSLTRAEIYFAAENFQPEYDMITFASASQIQAQYDYQLGKLILTGHAPKSDYETVLRSIQYNHLNTLDPDLRMRKLSMVANDDNGAGPVKDLMIDLKYTFIELEIPTGFTPNGDQANDTWIISRPGGLEQLTGAVVRVFNRRGMMVFEGRGFGSVWDGTFNGNLLPADTYFYTIDLNLRSKKTYRGTVTLLR